MGREGLRRPLLGLAWWLVRLLQKPWPELPPGPVLVIAPHPDDAALGCGGLTLHWRGQGRDVHIACLTDGAASHPGNPAWPAEKLRSIRRAEEAAAAAALGLPESCLHFFDAPDGRLDDPGIGGPLAARLARLTAELRPALLLTTSRHEPSSEHRAAWHLARAAAGQCGNHTLLGEYLVWARWSPPAFLRTLLRARNIHHLSIPPGHRRPRLDAIRAHASQHSAPCLPEGFFRIFDRPEEVWFTFKDTR